MATLVTDNFTRANAANLGANWTKSTYATSTFTIATNLATAVHGGGTTNAYWNGAQVPNADHWSEVVLAANPATNDGGPMVRGSTTAQTFYCIRINFADTVALGGSQTFNLYSFVATVATVVGSTATQVINVGDTLRVEVQGTALRGYLNGVLTASGAPSATATGSVGMDWWAPSAVDSGLSLFNAGDFSVASVLKAPTRPFPFKPGSPNPPRGF